VKIVVSSVVLMLVLAACGGGSTPTSAPSAPPASPPPVATASAVGATADAGSAEALCLLTPEDWQQFNYITGASPDVTSDGPGSAICQYASGLFLEVYTHADETEAEATYQTVLDSIPVDEPQEVPLPGADEVVIDPSTGDGEHAGIVVRAGRLVYTISTRSGDEAQAQLTALAALVLARAGTYI
jgi:hypothetical protein